jgi:hypothetical protein
VAAKLFGAFAGHGCLPGRRSFPVVETALGHFNSTGHPTQRPGTFFLDVFQA